MRVAYCLGSGWGRLWQRSCIACPDEDSALLIHRQAFRVNYFLSEGFEILVIQVETQLEGAIGEALFTCEQLDDLRQDLRKFHGSLSRLHQRGLCPGLDYNTWPDSDGAYGRWYSTGD
jgi:hypothetical protein